MPLTRFVVVSASGVTPVRVDVTADASGIQPLVRVSGPSGATASILHRCFPADPVVFGAGT